MRFTHILWTLLLAITLFVVIVALGLKFQWGEQLDGNNKAANDDQGVVYDEKGNRIFSSKTAEKKKSEPEMLNERSDEDILRDDIRRQCRQLSVDSGVPDEQMESTIEACVILTMDSEDDVATESSTQQPQNTRREIPEVPAINNAASNLPKVDNQSFYALTKQACEIVANEEKGLSPQARQQMIQSCIDNNLNAQN